LVVLREALKENEMQTLEALTKKDRCAIARLIERKRGKRTTADERAAIVNKTAETLDIRISGGGTNATAYGCSSLNEDGWNNTVQWLDRNYPGWRGYPVTYPDGRVG